MSNIFTTYWAFVLSISTHCRILILVNATSMSKMSFAGEFFLGGSGDNFLAYHAHYLFLMNESVNTWNSLVSCNGGKSLKSLIVFIDQNNRWFFFFSRYLLVFDGFDSVDDAIGDHSIEDVYEVLLVRETISLWKIFGDLGPFSSGFAAFPYPLCWKLLPVRQMLNPFHFSLLQ